jgi:hypothetical protein
MPDILDTEPRMSIICQYAGGSLSYARDVFTQYLFTKPNNNFCGTRY